MSHHAVVKVASIGGHLGLMLYAVGYFRPRIKHHMKKLTLLTTLCAALSTASFAQQASGIGLHLPTQKGSSFIGSNLLLAQLSNSDFSPNDNSLHYNLGLSPRYGRFVTNHLALGVDLAISLDGYTKTPYRAVFTNVGVFGRYYFGEATNKQGVQNKLRFFVEAGAGYGHVFNRYTNTVNNVEEIANFDYNTFNFHVMPGVNYFLSRNVALEGGLNFSRSHSAVDEPHLRDNFNNLSLSVGLQFFFGRK